MVWDLIKLNDGHSIPSIAFGTWTLGNGQAPIDQVAQALDTGFSHIDTAQSYRNEAEAGQALHESGLGRRDVFITTKFSGTNGADIPSSIDASLKNLGVSYVDLYLIHHPSLAKPDIATAWAEMEKIKSDGKAKSIGVSNFDVADLQTLLKTAKVPPAANQILLHPYVYQRQQPILEFAQKNNIAIEAYSILIPLTHEPGGAVDKPLKRISARLQATPEQILLAWAKAKGAVAVTTSSRKERLEGYQNAGDLKLTDRDILDIDYAGAIGARSLTARTIIRRAAGLALVGAAVIGACTYFGVKVPVPF